jgi:hypothetical protein
MQALSQLSYGPIKVCQGKMETGFPEKTNENKEIESPSDSISIRQTLATVQPMSSRHTAFFMDCNRSMRKYTEMFGRMGGLEPFSSR